MSEIDDKKKLYEQIVSSTDDGMLLDRMRELGFWPDGEDVPDDPADEAKEALLLEQEIARLRKKSTLAQDPDAALAAERVRRWEESKLRRKKNKIDAELDRKARAEAWEVEKKNRVASAGDGVSGGLFAHPKDTRAPKGALPQCEDPKSLAAAMGIPLSELRWLTYHRRAAALVHYHRYAIPKKTGGAREISAPKPKLARAQEWILRNILDQLAMSPQTHGFVHERNVATGAAPHVGREVVVNVDLRDFFPSFGFRRVKGFFHALGYREPVAVVLALLCTEPPRAAALFDGQVFQVALGDRVLPQGACTSPALTNAICAFSFDSRLVGLAKHLGFAYTRYADDLTFSGDDPVLVGKLLRAVRMIAEDEGFEVNESKTRVMRRGRRQEVTGATVNAKVAVPRDERRRLRAILHNAAKHGLQSQNREGHPRFREHLRGRIAWVTMLDAGQGARLRALFDRIP